MSAQHIALAARILLFFEHFICGHVHVRREHGPRTHRVGRSLLTSPIRRIHALLLCAATQDDKLLYLLMGDGSATTKRKQEKRKKFVFDSSSSNTYQIIPYCEHCGALVGHQAINIPIPRRPSLHRLTQNPVDHKLFYGVQQHNRPCFSGYGAVVVMVLVLAFFCSVVWLDAGKHEDIGYMLCREELALWFDLGF